MLYYFYEIFQCDLRKEKERKNLYEFVFSKTNYLNVLVNATGIIKIASIEKTNLKEFKEMMEINLYAPFHLIKLLLPFPQLHTFFECKMMESIENKGF